MKGEDMSILDSGDRTELKFHKSNRTNKNGDTRGCYITHGLSGTRIYNIWIDMKKRCYDTKNNRYNRYGGRGITVCDEWKENFIAFRNWAYENGYAEGLSLDRIDNNGNYEPSNCRWATMKEQANNQNHTLKIKYKGEIKTLTEWAEILGIKRHTLYHRIYKRGWTIERAFSEKVSLDRYHRVKGA
jgi:hypothetical protein